jgi:hypothetical protein
MPLRLRARLVLLAAALTFALVVASPASARDCPGKFHSGFFTDLTVVNTTSFNAKQVLCSWVRKTHFGERAAPTLVTVGAWRCRQTILKARTTRTGG